MKWFQAPHRKSKTSGWTWEDGYIVDSLMGEERTTAFWERRDGCAESAQKPELAGHAVKAEQLGWSVGRGSCERQLRR